MIVSSSKDDLVLKLEEKLKGKKMKLKIMKPFEELRHHSKQSVWFVSHNESFETIKE